VRTLIALWLLCAFVTWNVAFDRGVNDLATEFTRDQILRYQAGRPVSSIDDAFSPRVRIAALHASAWAGGVLAVGAVIVGLDARSRRHPRSPRTSRSR
jgi:hypothetical protein